CCLRLTFLFCGEDAALLTLAVFLSFKCTSLSFFSDARLFKSLTVPLSLTFTSLSTFLLASLVRSFSFLTPSSVFLLLLSISLPCPFCFLVVSSVALPFSFSLFIPSLIASSMLPHKPNSFKICSITAALCDFLFCNSCICLLISSLLAPCLP